MADVCQKCGKAKEIASMGSITQWISACGCDRRDSSQDEDVQLICETCGKRISSGRTGSLTQWVFGPNSCECARPAVPGGNGANNNVVQLEPVPQEPEIEIPVDPGLFPQDRYKPLDRLGTGGAGAVYLCRDVFLGKKVAVKTLRHLSAEQLVAFQMEARATSALNHPNIVNILDFGVSQSGAPYMVLDYVPGLTLERYLKQHGKLEWHAALDIIKQLCSALAYAHERGIFHRDLKPGNVVLMEMPGEKLSVRLIDFGVAKIQEQTLPKHVFDGNTIVGTPAYMSPDQIAGRTYDGRSEIYSIGCVAFECIAGVPPFSAETPLETLSLHATKQPPTLNEITNSETIPQNVQDIISKCLAKEPDRRYQFMNELENAINLVLHGSPGSLTEEFKPASKQDVRNWAVAVISCLMLAGIAYSVISVKGSSTIKSVPDKQKVAKHRRPLVPVMVTGGEDFSNQKKTRGPKFERGTYKKGEYLQATEDVTDEDLRGLDGVKVRTLRLNASQVTGSGLAYLKDSGIETLELDYLPFKEKFLDQLNPILPGLKCLTFIGSNVSGAGIKKLNASDRLVLFKVAGCKRFDRGALIEVIKRFPNMRIVNLTNTAIKGTDFELLPKWKELRTLEVCGIDATFEQYQILARIPELRSLRLDLTDLTDKELLLFKRTKHLGFLSLLGCSKVSTAAQDELKKALPALRLQSEHEYSGAKNAADKTSQFYDMMQFMGEQ